MENSHEYRMEIEFGEQKKFAYEILANTETRERLKERMLRFVKAVHDRKVNSLVFLDRSARPLSWMFQDLWDGMYLGQKKPDIKYVNIGTSSHVHSGTAELLETWYGKTISDADAVQNKIVRSEGTDEWFSTKEIPQSWQRSIMKHTEISEELQTIFKKEFDEKTVLVVDEMSGRGKSQMAAAGFFALAFPNAKDVFSTALFYSRQFYDPNGVYVDTSEDKKVIPWLQELGMAGVLELPDKTLLSGAITQEHIQKILPSIQEQIENLKKDVEMHQFKEDQESLKRFLERKDLYEHPEKMIERARQLRKELKQLAGDALHHQTKNTKPLT